MKYFVGALVILAAGLAFAQEPGSKLYIPAPAPQQTLTDGTKVVTTTGPQFNLVLQSAMFKERVPFKIVDDSAQADYVLHWSVIPEEAKNHGSFHTATSKELYTVSASLVSKDSQVVWSGSADKKNLLNCAQIIAKQLNSTMKHR